MIAWLINVLKIPFHAALFYCFYHLSWKDGKHFQINKFYRFYTAGAISLISLFEIDRLRPADIKLARLSDFIIEPVQSLIRQPLPYYVHINSNQF